MLNLSEEISISKIEEIYKSLMDDHSDEMFISGKSILKAQPGYIASLIQIINTCIRKEKIKTVVLDLQNNQVESLLKDIHLKPHVISALLMLSKDMHKVYFNKEKTLQFNLYNLLTSSYKEIERPFDKQTLYVYQKRLERAIEKK